MQVQAQPITAVVNLPRGRPALFLSPHFDDVAFSCVGLIHDLCLQGSRPFWVTVFASATKEPTGFALECQTTKGVAADCDYMALRRNEDIACAHVLDVEPPKLLDFLEAPNRGYESSQSLFGKCNKEDVDITLPAIVSCLAELLETFDPAYIVAPLGLGGHVDHRLLTSAVKEIVPVDKQIFYAENPYLLRCTRVELDELTADMCLFYHDVSLKKEIKSQASACYRSQLEYQLRNIGTVHDFVEKSIVQPSKFYDAVPERVELYFMPNLN